MAKLKLNKKDLVDGIIAAITVENAPLILSKFGLPVSGVTGQVSAAALSYLVGMLLKKPQVANVGIAVAVGNLVNEIAVQPLLNTVLPSANSNQLKNYTALQNYTRLKDYIHKPKIVRNYAQIYS